jgi:hypothetical protein
MSETERMPPEDWKWRRAEVIIRDDYRCQECGDAGGPEGNTELHVHHINPVSEGGCGDLQNLTTLCKGCHNSAHSNESSGAEAACENSLRNPNRDDDSGKYTEKYPRADFIKAIDDVEMAGTQDVADSVGCSYETAYKKLRALEDDGAIQSRKVANSRVWTLPSDD